MFVDLGALLVRAFQTVIKNRTLWILGFCVALLSGAGSSNFRVDATGHYRLFDMDLQPGAGLALIVGLGALLLGIALFLLRAALDASLIAAVDRTWPPSGEPLTVRGAW